MTCVRLGVLEETIRMITALLAVILTEFAQITAWVEAAALCARRMPVADVFARDRWGFEELVYISAARA